ncbi:MAG: hypothetical protein HYW86_02550 [Candidatus Roizmanbacteria bacterium]|nr:MAG: hypothetical protein HYW86_02550 [Candidatus Roizmanbacteria bacterium]
MEGFFSSFNVFDVLFIFFILYFVTTSHDFITSLFDFFGFLFTVIFSYKNYVLFAQVLVFLFDLPKGISLALGFFVAWLFAEILLFILSRYTVTKLSLSLEKNFINKFLTFIPATAQAVLFYLLVVATLFALPVRASVKEQLLQSRSAPYFINFSHIIENNVKSVFGTAVNETLNFLTLKEKADETISLDFKAQVDKLKIDESSEKIMLSLINKERNEMGLLSLIEDQLIREAARDYAVEMMTTGIFSHTSQIDGTSPAQRLERKGVKYEITGENLAYAPDVYVSHKGLMNSPGHRRNILSEEYSKVGIGIIDGGIYGRIFVQEFTN